MTQFISRAYNTFELNDARSIITKTSDSDRLSDEIKYYSSLPKQLSIFFPRVIESKCQYKDHRWTGNELKNSLSLEYYTYDDLGKLMVNGDFATNEASWYKSFYYLKNIFKEFFVNSFVNNEKHTSSMYLEKTSCEYEKLIKGNSFFNKLANYDQITINNQSYLNFHKIWPKITPFLKKHFTHPFKVIHGDLCFSNILYGQNTNGDVVLKLIDPRGSFGERGYIGDSCYDFAKLFHSFEGGYEYIIHDKFKLEQNDNNFKFQFINDNRDKIKQVFNHIFSDFNFYKQFYKHFKFLQGLIFIGMCARHYDSLDRQKIMYCTGIKILNECLEENNL